MLKQGAMLPMSLEQTCISSHPPLFHSPGLAQEMFAPSLDDSHQAYKGYFWRKSSRCDFHTRLKLISFYDDFRLILCRLVLWSTQTLKHWIPDREAKCIVVTCFRLLSGFRLII